MAEDLSRGQGQEQGLGPRTKTSRRLEDEDKSSKTHHLVPVARIKHLGFTAIGRCISPLLSVTPNRLKSPLPCSFPPTRIRTVPGRQTHYGAFWAKKNSAPGDSNFTYRYILNKTAPPILHWAQAAPTKYKDRNLCIYLVKVSSTPPRLHHWLIISHMTGVHATAACGCSSVAS